MDQEQVEMKECSKCGKPFPNTIKNFYRLKSGKLRAHCIDCHKKKYSYMYSMLPQKNICSDND